MKKILDLKGARETLSGMGIVLSERQMKRAADKDAHGMRKLPFFVDPIDKRLKIEKGALQGVYNALANEAQNNAYFVADIEDEKPVENSEELLP